MAGEDVVAGLLLAFLQGLPDDERQIVMSWIVKPATERARLAGTLPDLGATSHLSFGTAQPQLTGRELQVLLKLAEGSEIAAIAAEMGISEATLRNHLRNVVEKLSISAHTTSERPELTMLPVRLPKDTYEELKRWASEHGFPMSVIVRGLVERFLDQQRAA